MAIELRCGAAAPVAFLPIPPGPFTMGEGPTARRVVLTAPAALGRTAVTVGQFAAFVAATGHRTTAEATGTATVFDKAVGAWVERPGFTWRAPGFAQGDDHPVTVVSWFDAVAFCRWLGSVHGRTVRLPTEAERECATRAGTATAWSFGDDPADLPAHAWYDATTGAGTPAGGTRPVATLRANPWGFHDLHGNVIEWCGDWHAADLAALPDTDPQGPAAGDQRVLRGGCWDFAPGFGRSANRGHLPPAHRFGFFGFRAALAP
ncbi:MAG: hypothetical protein RLZZ127_494 [Planctomycetota bacterium]|jgi:formylglycine-generating enzyme required for sulfatase activity